MRVKSDFGAFILRCWGEREGGYLANEWLKYTQLSRMMMKGAGVKIMLNLRKVKLCRGFAWLLAMMLLIESCPWNIARAEAAPTAKGEPVVFNFITNDVVQLRTLTSYSETIPNWMYIADTMDEVPTTVITLSVGMQLRAQKGEWLALKVKIPESGVFRTELEYTRDGGSGIMESYLLPLSTGTTEAAIQGALTEETCFGRVDLRGTYGEVLKTPLSSVAIAEPGEYLLVLKAVDTSGSGFYLAYPQKLTFTPDFDASLQGAESALSKSKLYVGETAQLNTYAEFTGGATTKIPFVGAEIGQKNINVTAKSENSEIATIDSSGVVHAIGVGDTTIQVEVQCGELKFTQNVPVHVSARELSYITIIPERSKLYVNEEIEYEVKLFDENNVEFQSDIAELQVTSSDPSVISVVNGKLVGVQPGSATVTASVNYTGATKKATASVEILPRVFTSAKLLADYRFLTLNSDGAQLCVMLLDNLGHEIDSQNATVKYKSNNPEIIAVSESGWIAPKALGDTTLSAEVTLGGITHSCEMPMSVKQGNANLEFNLRCESPGIFQSIRTMTEYNTYRDWAYVADTVSLETNPVFALDNFLQLRATAGEWVALKMRVSKAGTYAPALTYWANREGANVEVYFMPLIDDPTVENISSLLTEKNKIGEEDFYSKQDVTRSTLFDSRELEEKEYLLVFRMQGNGVCIFPSQLRLDGSGVTGMHQLSSTITQTELVAGESIQMNGEVTLTSGISYKLQPPSFPIGNSTAQVSFSSTDQSVLTIDKTGRVTARAPGLAMACVTVGMDNAQLRHFIPVRVNEKQLTEIKATLERDAFIVTQRARPDIYLYLDDGREFEGEGAKITLSSSAPDIVAVEGLELVAAAPGEAKITVTAQLGKTEKIAEFLVTVQPEAIGSVKVTTERRYLKPDDSGVQLYTQFVSNIGKPILSEGLKIIWRSENPETVKVNETGFVTPVSLGWAKIVASVPVDGKTYEGEISILVKEGKVGRTYYTDKKVNTARENIEKYSWARDQHDQAVKTAEKYVRMGEDKLWSWIVGEGIPRACVMQNWGSPNMHRCPYCGVDVNSKYGFYGWIINPLSKAWKVTCPECRRAFPSNDFESLYQLGLDEHGVYNRKLAHERNAEQVANGGQDFLKNTLYPEKESERTGWAVDDGMGWNLGHTYSQTQEEIYAFIPLYLHLGMWDQREGGDAQYRAALTSLRDAYLFTGDAKYGRLGAIMIDRIADIYPDLDLNQYFKYFGNSDSGRGEGKAIGCIWEAQRIAPMLADAYDAFYPAMEDPQVVSFLSQKAQKYKLNNDKTTPEKIRENGVNGILRQIYEGCKTGNIRGNFGMEQKALSLAAIVHDDMPETQEWIDYVFQKGTHSYMNHTGADVMDTLISKISREGFGNEGSVEYSTIWVSDLLGTAEVLSGYTAYDRADLFNNPKFVKMFYPWMDVRTCSRGWAHIGDTGFVADTNAYNHKNFLLPAYTRLKDPKLAQMLYATNGNSTKDLRGNIFTPNPEGIAEEIQQVIDTYGEYDFTKSTNFPGFGFTALRGGGLYKGMTLDNEQDTQRDFWMYYGVNNGHGHSDTLNLGIEAFGLNMAPDLGYPEETGLQPNRMQWVRNTISHNTVVVNEQQQSSISYNAFPQRYDDVGRVKVMDVDAPNAYAGTTDVYRRTVVMVEVDDTVSYGVDFFRVRGGNHHMYSFHSQSDEISKYSGFDPVPQVDENGEFVGTYAGPEIAWGATTSEGTGYNWLHSVRRAKNVNTGHFMVDFKVKDFRDILPGDRDLHLRMTMLNKENLSEITIASGNVPDVARNAMFEPLEYVLASRKGKNLDTLFTTVYEPYEGSRYVENIEAVEMECISGVPSLKDTARAVRVTHKDGGRVDYIIYSTNPSVTYRVDGQFEFCGSIGVYTLVNGEMAYAYVNEGEKIGSLKAPQPSITGKVHDFTQELAFDNTITVRPRTAVDPEKLAGEHIYIQNDGKQNAVYPIESAEMDENGRLVLHVGNQSFIRNYIDPSNINGGYLYNFAKEQEFRIPLSAYYDVRPMFTPISQLTVDANRALQNTIGAKSPVGKKITLRAVSLPRGAQFDAETGLLFWRPDRHQVGKHHVAIEATDGILSTTMHFSIRVFDETTGEGSDKPINNQHPGISGGEQGDEIIPPIDRVEKDEIHFVAGAGETTAESKLGTVTFPERAFEENGQGTLIIKKEGGKFNISVTTNVEMNETTAKVSIPYTPSENMVDKNCILVKDGEGNMIPSSRYEDGKMVFYTDSFGAFEIVYNPKSFADLENHAWASEAITRLAARGIINGITATTYGPGRNITRADFTTLIVRAFGFEDKAGSFADVPANVYYAKTVGIAKTLGIIGGVNETDFAPTMEITRQDMMVIVARALDKAGYVLSTENKVEISDSAEVDNYAKDAVQDLTASGIIAGSNGKINPKGKTTRAEVAVILDRILFMAS